VLKIRIHEEFAPHEIEWDRLELEKYAMQAEAVRRRKAFLEAASWILELNITPADVAYEKEADCPVWNRVETPSFSI
jgi:hypothetical protein